MAKKEPGARSLLRNGGGIGVGGGSGVAGKELWGVGGSVVVEVCGFLALAASEGVGWWW